MDDENLTMNPEDDVEVGPTIVPVSDEYFYDTEIFESSELVIDHFQFRVLKGQKAIISILFIIALELLVMILLICRRRK